VDWVAPMDTRWPSITHPPPSCKRKGRCHAHASPAAKPARENGSVLKSSPFGGILTSYTRVLTETDGPTVSRERTRYEVHTLKGDHWVLNGVHDSEAAARRTSAALLAAGRIEATRIVRDWLRPDGRHVETEIACDRRPPARTLTVVAIDEPPEVCVAAQDFYGQGARMAMGRLLRRYAEHAVVTPTEILHNHGEMKRLSDTGTLVAGAVGRVAVLQAEKTGIAGAERRDALYRAVDDLDRRARWAAGLTDLPQVDLVGLAAAMEGIHAIAPEEEWDFLARVALCRDLVARRNWLAKFDWLHDLMLAGGGLPDRPMALADGVLADVAGAPGLAGELLAVRLARRLARGSDRPVARAAGRGRTSR
jgi:hypothetical protein